MRDFIFVIGASGIGKTTLAQNLFAHYNGAYVETNMVPEFGILPNVDEGLFEEQVCWECTLAQLHTFHRLGIRNIVCSDLDDLRTVDLPELFKGYNFITLKLVCSDYQQNVNQMLNRGDGLIDLDLLEKMSAKVNNRPLLINEFVIDVSGKDSNTVLTEAKQLIDSAQILLDYEYIKPPMEQFYSWVYSNGLR